MVKIPSTEEIERLVDAKASESIVLDFKAAPYRNTDSDKKECLKDISAFANTHGGLLLIGVAERNNAADSLNPLAVSDAEAQRARINDLLHAGLEPRVFGVQVDAVQVAGGAVLAVAVPRSPARPHRVTSGNSNRFWLRNSTAAYEANVTDLRNLFLQSAEMFERAERYHRDRIGPIRKGDVVFELARESHGMFMHIVPSDAFSPVAKIDPVRALKSGPKFQPIASTGYTPRFSFDGFLNVRGGSPSYGYTLVRREGIVEAVKMKLAEGEDFPADAIEARLIRPAHRYTEGLLELGVAPPYYAYATLVGVGGRRLISQHLNGGARDRISRDVLHLPVAVIETLESVQPVAAAFRPAMDAMWNAWGYEGSPSYKSGNWVQQHQEH